MKNERKAIRKLEKRKHRAKSIVEVLRSPDGFIKIMGMVGPARLAQRLNGELRLYVLTVHKTLTPGEKAVISSTPLEHDFQLKYVMVPLEVTFATQIAAPRLFFHHDQILPDVWKPGFGSKMPASIILCEESSDMQLWDLYRKHVYAKDQIFEVGVFENVGDEPLDVKIGILGYVRNQDVMG